MKNKEIYLIAAEMIFSMELHTHYACWAITKASGKDPFENHKKFTFDHKKFPEFMLFNPNEFNKEEVEKDETGWFDNREERIFACLFASELAKESKL